MDQFSGSGPQLPQPAAPSAAFTCVYDAWNRLVQVSDTATQESVAHYAYDGRNFRIVKGRYTDGTLSETRHAYYSSQWQLLEERTDTSTTADRQFVWGLRYIDDLILRDRTTLAALSERLYALQDANWNVAAIATAAGTLAEHYLYTAYGRCTALDAAFATLTTSAYAWEHLFTGRLLDAETGLMHYRARYYHTGMGRFVNRDPIGYGGGINLYAYVGNSPSGKNDPQGLQNICETIGEHILDESNAQECTAVEIQADTAGYNNCVAGVYSAYQKVYADWEKAYWNQIDGLNLWYKNCVAACPQEGGAERTFCIWKCNIGKGTYAANLWTIYTAGVAVLAAAEAADYAKCGADNPCQGKNVGDRK